MKLLKKKYYYLFYKIYRFIESISESNGGKFWSDWKASLVLDCLIYFLLISLFIYYNIFINPYANLDESNIDIFVVVVIVALFNYFVFHHRDQWKKIVVEYDKLAKKKNKIGSWIVIGVITMIIVNLIYAFYLMSQIDWSKYR
ncbi:hypothetical protein [Chryseobacterium indologenes]|uniref:Uncharacterized protein n=1 Tax=Chryseobacterium indologenes TaxID=253 RepID=A0A0N0ITP7_CHRID|nr:hypothetical protein [Chryseobacterium indologenes]KPE48943.1 hypothetical protein AOB46_22680 [Chryseobacterium indologenes]